MDCNRCGHGVERVLRHKPDGRQHPIEGVISRVARHEVGGAGAQAVLVEEAGDAGAGHAAPVVVVALKQADEDGHLGVA